MAQEDKYAYDEESVKAIMNWAGRNRKIAKGSNIIGIRTYIRYIPVYSGKYQRHQATLSGCVL